MTDAAVLQASHLHKAYGPVVAVQDVSINLYPGEILGLLGPNGAGKSTTIAMLSGLLAPDRGRITLDGKPFGPHARDLKARIGLVPQDLALYPDLTARENLRFWARMYGLSGRDGERRIGEVLDMVGLTPYADRLVRTYSGGMKRRLNLAAGVLHRPAVLFLDEPTVGVDPQSRHAIFDLVRSLAESGTAVLYTTHYMEEAQALCHRVAIMDRGRIIAEGAPETLIRQIGGGMIRLEMPEPHRDALARYARTLEGVQRVVLQEGAVLVQAADPHRTLLDLLHAAGQRRWRIQALRLVEPNLEAVFLALTGKTLRDG